MQATESSLLPDQSLGADLPCPAPLPFWRRPDPAAGLALVAAAGILAADWIDLVPWTALGLAPLTALVWQLRRSLGWFWLAIAVAFGVLHLFSLHGPPAETLAGLLPSNPNDAAARIHAVGVVLDEPRVSGASVARFRLQLERAETAGYAWESNAVVLTYWKNGLPACGDRLELTGAARNIASPRNPGEFDFADYERRQGVRSEIHCSGMADVCVVSHGSRTGFRRLAARFHDWMRDSLGLGLEPGLPPAAIISTMLLGLRDDPGLGDLEELFQRTGTLHYFAIDGLKLGLLACLAWWLLERAGVPPMWARTVCLPPLAFYAMATGLGPASLRAIVMAVILVGAFWVERPVRALNSLGFAAAALLFCDTNQLFDLGFQLTFCVVLAIILLVGPLHQRLMTLGAPDPFLPARLYSTVRRNAELARRWGWGLVSVALVAWLGSLPIMILRFHVVSPVSPLANVLTFPMAWTVLALGVVALIFAAVGVVVPGGTAAAAWVNHVNAWAAKLFLATAQMLDATPGSSFFVATPSQWTLGHAPLAEVTVLDLGISRAIHLRVGSADWMIDAGQPFEYGRSVRPYLHARGLNRLDGFIMSQADTHHLGAASAMLTEFRPLKVIDSSGLPGRSPRRQEVLDLLAHGGKHAEVLRAGAALPLGAGAELRALYPPAGLKAGTAADRALVLQLRAAGWRVLLMANSSAEVERWLTEHLPTADLRSDVVVTGAPSEELGNFPRAIGAELVVSQAPGRAQSGLGRVMQSVDSGAVRVRLWDGRWQADGFVDKAEAGGRR